MFILIFVAFKKNNRVIFCRMPSCSSDNGHETQSNETEDVWISDDSEDQSETIKNCLKHELITDNFDVKRKIGGGGCGFVYKVVHKCDKAEYALKFVPFDNLDVAKRETEALATLKHENIMRYRSSWKITVPMGKSSDEEKSGENESMSCSESEVEMSDEGENDSNIVFEDDSSGSAFGVFRDCLIIQTELYDRNLKMLLEDEIFSMNDDTRCQIVLDIVNGLEYIHSKGYMHRDLKPSNILLDKLNRAKIGDFGFAIRFKDNEIMEKSSDFMKRSLTPELGTLYYIAPEVKISSRYNEKVDLYSLGIILFEMYSKMGTQMERNETLTMIRNERSLTSAVNKIPKQHKSVRKVVSRLLRHDPCLRRNLQYVKKWFGLKMRCHRGIAFSTHQLRRLKRPIRIESGEEKTLKSQTRKRSIKPNACHPRDTRSI